MLEVIAFLYSYGYYGGDIGNMFAQWEQVGVFSYVLPFLLLFALTFGILSQSKIFSERSINGIIALVISIMALQFDFVPVFFSEIFPRVGVGLAIFLVAMIFLGIVSPKQTWIIFVWFGIGAIILVVILINTAGNLGWYTGYFWNRNWFNITLVVCIIIVLGVIVGAGKNSTTSFNDIVSPLLKRLNG